MKPVLDEQSFRQVISVERKRTERSRNLFLLMLVDTGANATGVSNGVADNIIAALASETRETDVLGWHKFGQMLGVMFTEISQANRNSILELMLGRMGEVLRQALPAEQFENVRLAFHLFPEDWEFDKPEGPTSPALYPDLATRRDSKRTFTVLKRVVDISGSCLAMLVGSPLFLLIALGIKLSSRGPVFFRQERIGQYGVPFTFLKFRSMCVNTDADAHKEYVRKLIAGEINCEAADNAGPVVYKMTEDSRVTPIGKFLRRTSLDELPQFFNVLRGDMSLVGPRPPIAYEVEAYEIWHRARLLEAKPGITGLWQVKGRSRVKFDEMVRLDLRYARTWTPWLDIKILLQTPKAVVLGEGAF